MTVGAGHGGVRPGQRERRIVVIKARRDPGACVVADFALLRIARSHMIRISGSVEVIQVASNARSTGEVVVSIQVALRALHAGVRSCQRKSGSGVVESRPGPVCGAVARITSLREPGLHMVRIRRALKVFQMTRCAGAGGQTVVPAHVTLGALQCRMRAGQGKTSSGVVEGCVPVGGGVTRLTSLREASLRVRGIGCALKI